MATLILQDTSSVWSGTMLAKLNTRLTALLNELAKVDGLQSAFVCDNQGRVLGATVSGPADLAVFVVKTKRLTDRMGIAVAQCLAALSTRSNGKDLEMCFEHQSLFVHDLGNAFIVIVMTQETHASLVRMALNVAANAFENDGELQRHLQTAIPTRATVLNQNAMDASTWQLVEKARLNAPR
jgi:hypothetical protein